MYKVYTWYIIDFSLGGHFLTWIVTNCVWVPNIIIFYLSRLVRSVSTRRVPPAVSVTWRLVRERTCASLGRISGTLTARGTRLQLVSELVSREERENKKEVVHFLSFFCSDSDASSEDSQSRSRTHSITTPSPTGACTSNGYYVIASDHVLF